MIHLDKALARIREYERMKLKAEFNPCNASTAGAGGSDVSNTEHPSANPADQVEGTESYNAARVHHVQRPVATESSRSVCWLSLQKL